MTELENYSPYLVRQIQLAWQYQDKYVLAMMLSLASSAMIHHHSEIWKELHFLHNIVNEMDWRK